MIFEYIHSDSSRETVSVESQVKIDDEYKYFQTENKKDFIQKFLPAFISGQKMVLFDSKHKDLVDFYAKSNINTLDEIHSLESQLLFFTSGSSGFPLGAFKSRTNLLTEVEVLKGVVSQKNITKVIVTVPFVHIYGILAGLLLPYYLEDVNLLVKEDFLPYELVNEAASGTSLVITTPVFIKALAKLDVVVDLKQTIFISSTAPLQPDDVRIFENKYATNLMQLFGSTETGGIAYKFGDSTQWIPLKHVEVKSVGEKLCVTSPFVSKYLLNDTTVEVVTFPFVTEDIIELDSRGFTLLGRSNKLIKIAGKRISTQAIESIIEEIPQVEKAVVTLVYKKALLRSEQIVIQIKSTQVIEKKIIKEKIKANYGVLSIPFSIEYNDKITLSSMGKKIIF